MITAQTPWVGTPVILRPQRLAPGALFFFLSFFYYFLIGCDTVLYVSDREAKRPSMQMRLDLDTCATQIFGILRIKNKERLCLVGAERSEKGNKK